MYSDVSLSDWYKKLQGPPERDLHDLNCVFFILLDIDECIVETSGCEHYCVNTLGTYECFCRLGFRLDQDQHSCICELHLYYTHSWLE